METVKAQYGRIFIMNHMFFKKVEKSEAVCTEVNLTDTRHRARPRATLEFKERGASAHAR